MRAPANPADGGANVVGIHEPAIFRDAICRGAICRDASHGDVEPNRPICKHSHTCICDAAHEPSEAY